MYNRMLRSPKDNRRHKIYKDRAKRRFKRFLIVFNVTLLLGFIFVPIIREWTIAIIVSSFSFNITSLMVGWYFLDFGRRY